jgi:predicted ArsR family transcriptional regulator
MQILEVLQDAEGPLDVRELARRVGLHVNTARVHLRVLAEAGLVSTRREQRARPGRPRFLYEAAADSLDAGAFAGYRLLAEILASHLAGSEPDPSAGAERTGRAWGAHLVRRPAPFTSISKEDTVDQLVGLHEQLGFRPELKRATDGKEIVLRRCPFEQVATTYQAVICPARGPYSFGVLMSESRSAAGVVAVSAHLSEPEGGSKGAKTQTAAVE